MKRESYGNSNNGSDRSDNLPIHNLPGIYITLSAFQRMKCFVDLCDYEINGLGTVDTIGNNFVITDTFLMKQTTNTNALKVEIDKDALNHFVYQMVQKREDPSKLKFQWHSHVHEAPFFSPEDKNTIEGYLNDFMISMVMNKRGEYRCRLDLFKPFRLGVEIPIYILVPTPKSEFIKDCREEMERYLTLKERKFSLSRSQNLSRQVNENTGLISLAPENLIDTEEEDDND